MRVVLHRNGGVPFVAQLAAHAEVDDDPPLVVEVSKQKLSPTTHVDDGAPWEIKAMNSSMGWTTNCAPAGHLHIAKLLTTDKPHQLSPDGLDLGKFRHLGLRAPR